MTREQIIHDLEALRAAFLEERNAVPMCLGEAIKLIKDQKEIPHGKWIEEPVPIGLVGRGNGQYRCSNCQHGDIQAKTQEVPFCWYCGAKMEKKEADHEQ